MIQDKNNIWDKNGIFLDYYKENFSLKMNIIWSKSIICNLKLECDWKQKYWTWNINMNSKWKMQNKNIN